MENLKDQIRNSAAFKSFQAELFVANQFEEMKWSVVNSCHYIDLKEEKTREIDVVASLSGKKIGKSYAVAKVHAVVECKSMKGFHLIANSWCENDEGDSDFINFSWFGSDRENKAHLYKSLAERGISLDALKSLYNHFNLWFFPYQPKRIFGLCLPSYSVGIECSGFRETNIGSEKDLENSVIWKACLALKSAIKSFSNYHSEFFKTDIEETLIQYQPSEFPKENKSLLRHWNSISNIVYNFHPIIVTEAKLWAVSGENIIEKPAIRLYQRDFMDLTEWWVDVVTYDALPEYVEKLTAHYREKFKERKLKLF